MNFRLPVNERSSACVYFAADSSPFDLPALRLNAKTNHKIVRTICLPTSIQPNYAPPDKVLISVNLDPQFDYANPEIRRGTLNELVELFGSQVNDWEEIEFMRILNALPDYGLNANLEDMDYIVCGDYSSTPSINNAFASGRQAATKFLKDRQEIQQFELPTDPYRFSDYPHSLHIDSDSFMGMLWKDSKSTGRFTV